MTFRPGWNTPRDERGKEKVEVRNLSPRLKMVDPKGIEPSTSRMRTVRSSQLSYGPKSAVPQAEQKKKQYEIIDVAEKRTLCAPN